MDKYVRILKTAQTGDVKECAHWSTEIGFLTGEETKVRQLPKTHTQINAVLMLPFLFYFYFIFLKKKDDGGCPRECSDDSWRAIPSGRRD